MDKKRKKAQEPESPKEEKKSPPEEQATHTPEFIREHYDHSDPRVNR